MQQYININFSANSQETKEILIAELSEIGFEGFIENDSFQELQKNFLSAFIKQDRFKEDEMRKILSEKNISYTKTIIPKTNWNAKWESEFEPVVIDEFVAVRASFHAPVKKVKYNIVITPKMSFGTGHHATTYLMLQQMQRMTFNNKSVLDFGTGTGVLAIMAKKLGAKTVMAIDTDEWSINNAKENFEVNNCKDIQLLQKDNLDELPPLDVIMCNINLNIILQNTLSITYLTNQSSQVLLSGFLVEDEKTIVESFTNKGFTCSSIHHKENWLSVLWIKE